MKEGSAAHYVIIREIQIIKSFYKFRLLSVRAGSE